MGIVTLVSGGLDSTLIAKLALDEGLNQYPLFIDYGQRARDRELAACRNAMKELGLPNPQVANLSGFGLLIHSGLTDATLDVVHDAFTPGRNMLFVLIAAAYAVQIKAEAISIGLLDETTSIFPDQTGAFLRDAEGLINRCMNREIKLLAPLSSFRKSDVVALAKLKGIRNTYSCHTGNETECGFCIACREYEMEGE